MILGVAIVDNRRVHCGQTPHRVTQMGFEVLLELAPTDLGLLRPEHEEAGGDVGEVGDGGSQSVVHDHNDRARRAATGYHRAVPLA